MVEGIRWRKAVVVSLFIHGILLTGVGWMAAKTFAVHEVPEQYVELELASELDGLSGNYSNTASDNVFSNKSQGGASAAVPMTTMPSVAKEVVSSVQVNVSNMSLLSVETGSSSSNTGTYVGTEKAGGAAGVGAGATGNGKNMGAGADVGTGKVGHSSGVSSPSILSRVEPIYPEQARQAGQQGTVVLKIQILENGRSGHVRVYHSSGSDLLDEAAIAAVRQWRFIPAKDRESSEPLVCYTTMPVVFKLNG